MCPHCQATGDYAHTVKYCPNNKDGRYNQGRSLADLNKLRNAAGRISVDNQGEMFRMRSRVDSQGEIGRMDSLGERQMGRMKMDGLRLGETASGVEYRRDPRSGGIGQMDEILKKIKQEEGENSTQDHPTGMKQGLHLLCQVQVEFMMYLNSPMDPFYSINFPLLSFIPIKLIKGYFLKLFNYFFSGLRLIIVA